MSIVLVVVSADAIAARLQTMVRRRLLPGGVTIAVLYSLVGVGTALLGPSSITSSAQTYGPIGTVMTLMETLVALGLAIHLGAYIGRALVPVAGHRARRRRGVGVLSRHGGHRYSLSKLAERAGRPGFLTPGTGGMT